MHGLLAASRTPRLDNHRLRRTVSIDDMVNIQRTLMRAGTALNNSLYLASVVRKMGKVRSVPVLLITVAGYRLLRSGGGPSRAARGNSGRLTGEPNSNPT